MSAGKQRSFFSFRKRETGDTRKIDSCFFDTVARKANIENCFRVPVLGLHNKIRSRGIYWISDISDFFSLSWFQLNELSFCILECFFAKGVPCIMFPDNRNDNSFVPWVNKFYFNSDGLVFCEHRQGCGETMKLTVFCNRVFIELNNTLTLIILNGKLSLISCHIIGKRET